MALVGYDPAGKLTGSSTYICDAEKELTCAASVTYKYSGDGKHVSQSRGKIHWYGAGNDPIAKIFEFAVLCFVLVAGAYGTQAHKRTFDFTIDHSKPYVYLKFDRVGNRKPLSAREPSKGLWIRLVNNSRFPIVVGTFDLETGDPGLGVYDEIVPVDLNAPPLGHGLGAGEPLPGTGRGPKELMLEGYSAGEVVSNTTIAPGASLL